MVTFMFWNLNKKRLEGMVVNLAKQYEIDVLMFAECVIPPSTLLHQLNEGRNARYFYAPSLGNKSIHLYTRFTTEFVNPLNNKKGNLVFTICFICAICSSRLGK